MITIEVEEQDGWQVLRVAGEVDLRTAPELRDRLNAVLAGGTERLVVDLEDVTFLDSTALSVLIGAHKRLARLGGALHLVTTRDQILRVLNITGLSRVFAVHPTLEDAVGG